MKLKIVKIILMLCVALFVLLYFLFTDRIHSAVLSVGIYLCGQYRIAILGAGVVAVVLIGMPYNRIYGKTRGLIQSVTKIKIYNAIASIAFIVSYIASGFKIDINLVLVLLLLFIPVIGNIVKSMKLPGGIEISFQDIQELQKLENRIPSDEDVKASKYSYILFKDIDPTIAMVALRIDIERIIRSMAQKLKLQNQYAMWLMLDELRKKEVLSERIFGPLKEIIDIANKAAHGARIEKDIAEIAFAGSYYLLQELESINARLEGINS